MPKRKADRWLRELAAFIGTVYILPLVIAVIVIMVLLGVIILRGC